jgi:membrane-associated phospholipid phosphatase
MSDPGGGWTRAVLACRAAALALALVASLSPTLRADDPGTRPLAPSPDEVGPPAPAPRGGTRAETDPGKTKRDDGRRTLGRFPVNFGRAAIGVFNRDNIAPALVGTAVTAVGSAFDEQVRDSLASEGDDVTATLSTLFGGLEGVALVASVFTLGRLADEPRLRAATYDVAVAAGVSVTYTFALKYAVGRERPNGENNQSFPSGHTSNAFAMAAALDGHYGKKVTIPAYALAAAVGYARLRDGVHWLSDVLAGAALGYIAGRTTVRVNGAPIEKKRAQVTVSPLLGPQMRGVQVAIAF